MAKLYLTTTLPYVNADPHIGFALEAVTTDAVARYRRLVGDEVFFSTGTDEHGQKMFEAAQKAGEDVQAYVDRYAAQFRNLKNVLDLSNDAFIRTTDAHHMAAAQEMWRRCSLRGDIYKKAYEGLYCVGCEAYKTDKDLNEAGRCALHPNAALQKIEEENYFFRFSAYQEKLISYLSRPGVILPEWRREEALAFVRGGLEDFSISRERSRLAWGIPVPDDDTQVMYVWFDALTNYISTLGWPEDASGNFKNFWQEGEAVQTAGKDQVRFQSLMWQAMLFSAGVKNTDTVVYHGFVTSGGQKMSKSLGNVINPLDLVAEYGTDAVRYFLLRHVHPFEDSDVTLERVKEAYNAGLANGLGNVVSRVMTMAQAHLPTPIEMPRERFPQEYADAMDAYELNRAMDVVWNAVAELDRRIAEEKPFVLVKSDPDAGRACIIEMVGEVARIAQMLRPCMPVTADAIAEAIRENKKPENLFPRKE